MKTMWFLAALAAAYSPAGAHVTGTGAGQMDFADCAGRYSATVEHLWLFDGALSVEAERRRDAFADLVAAFPDPAAALHRRVAAKAAQRALWDRASFAGDARAARLARNWLAACDSLLPGI
ncbi:MAG: hypothetical protein KF887_16535 [Paracoccaceae bacterium]|nr:MAG: hypothetical protein KF887_16535 [Paracoccaceae bacterium]